jgi:flagellar basal-body rod protein FlgC
MNVDNVFAPIDIAVSGLKAQSKQMEVISSNIANAQTVQTASGQPYRRLEAIFQSADEGIAGVEVARVVPDMSEFQMLLDPQSPRADERGYVAMPNVSIPVEIMNSTIASRAYQANAAILRRYQKMVETTLELLR